MPFISQAEREQLASNPNPITAGQRCYLWYSMMMKQWNRNPRWTTADDIYAWVMPEEDLIAEQRAKELAWQVFFVLHVMPYEELKCEENGDIE